jgi:hypothetical protein
MDDAIDLELLDLINKLNRIQKDVGAKNKDEVTVTGADGNVDKFLDLRTQMVSILLANISLSPSVIMRSVLRFIGYPD